MTDSIERTADTGPLPGQVSEPGGETTGLSPEIKHQLDGVVENLADEFQGVVPRTEVEQRARAKVDQFAGARIVAFIPTLVYRYVREKLQSKAS